MEGAWPIEKQMLQKSVREFMKKECPPEFVRDLDENPRFPMEIVKKMADMGLTGIRVPKKYGGVGGDMFDLTVIHEEISRISLAISNAVGVAGSWGAHRITDFGSEDQKKGILPRIAKGELIFSAATTEANAGTDVLGSMQTTARMENGHFVLNGEKMFISAADIADYIIVTCITDPDAHHSRRSKGISQIMVEPQKVEKGLDIRPIPKMSTKSSAYNVISFNEVRVPRENLLGEMNQGWLQLVKGHERHNLINSAQALGLCQAAFQDALKYAKERKTFGRPIGQYQLIQKHLTEMKGEIDIARNYLYYNAQKAANKEDYMAESLILKKFTSEITLKTVNNAMSIFGASGLTTELDIQRYYRDARHFITTPIPNEMVVNRLAMFMGLPKSY